MGTGNSVGGTVGLSEGEGVEGWLVDAFPVTQSPTRMSSSAKSPVVSRTPPGM